MTFMKKNLHFCNLKKKRVTDGLTDQWTDRPSYRDARTHLKKRKDRNGAVVVNRGVLTYARVRVCVCVCVYACA